jgi:hypothetical protein
VFSFEINAQPIDLFNNCGIWIVCEHLCTEPTGNVWKCTWLGRIAEASVAVGADCGPRWYSGNFQRDDGGCGNVECIQELLLSDAYWTACLCIECKPSLDRGLVYCSVAGKLLESIQLHGITAQ